MFFSFSEGPTIHLPFNYFSSLAVCTKSYTHITSLNTVLPPLALVPNVMISHSTAFCSLWTCSFFLGWALYSFPPMTATVLKRVLTFMIFCGVFDLAVVILHLWCYQYFIVPIRFMDIKNISISWAKYVNPFILKVHNHFVHHTSSDMGMVSFGIV